MPREKHGEYDYERRLPANAGKAVGSGLYVWLIQEVEQHYPALASKYTGQDRYRSILKELQLIDEDTAQSIHQEFYERRKADNRERHRQQQLFTARRCEELAEKEPYRREYLLRQAATLRKRYES